MIFGFSPGKNPENHRIFEKWAYFWRKILKKWVPFLAKITLKDGYGFWGSSDTPLSNSNLSTPPPLGQLRLLKYLYYHEEMWFSMIKISWNTLKFPENNCVFLFFCKGQNFQNFLKSGNFLKIHISEWSGTTLSLVFGDAMIPLQLVSGP